MLHDRLADPVDAGVVADGVVGGVDEDHLEVLVGRVLDPSKIQFKRTQTKAQNKLEGEKDKVALPFVLCPYGRHRFSGGGNSATHSLRLDSMHKEMVVAFSWNLLEHCEQATFWLNDGIVDRG